VSYEGSRKFATDGRRYKHPVDEALEAERRLRDHAAAAFDEFVILSFRASNRKPFEFSWLNEPELKAEFGAALARVSREYESRF
jgi:hypothetical protein